MSGCVKVLLLFSSVLGGVIFFWGFRIVMQGFPRPGHHQRSSALSGETSFLPKLPPRIPISSQFLLELSSGLYYAM